ncbi:MAG TPA: potassium transporter Kup [Gemmatimonadaceae bacterium]|jgi:KUP system potassium uptake protein
MTVEPPEPGGAEPAVPLQPNTPADPKSTGEIVIREPVSTGVPAPPPRNPAQPHPHRHRPEEHPTGRRLAVLSLTALGVVYGDIGTSPLYAIKECFRPGYGLMPTPVNVYGVLSLIVWALMLVISVKYVLFILRADNRGEGGVLALLALVQSGARRRRDARRRALLISLGLVGGAFLYGDGIITPAISVLSAVEGLEVATPALQHVIVPLAFIIIAGLFAVQRFGTARVGTAFGWITLLWFLSIAGLGIMEIARGPEVLWALNPWNGVRFFIDHPTISFVVLGAVVLVITGGEALYADMGHFGKRPIRVVWFGLVFPALLLNYFGQGALLLRNPAAVENPFYLLAPRPLLIPLLFIATAATIVASQALISGAFSLTQQAIQLGYMPRMTIRHTSAREAGQIYIPEINKALAIGTLLLVVGFGSSGALGGAYGVAVTGTMAITTILFVAVARQRWNWKPWHVAVFLILFLTIDLAFFSSNLLKIPHGGWVPLAVAVIVYTLMTTWKRGRMLLSSILRRSSLPLDLFLRDVETRKPVRVPGTAVFMTSDPEGTPVVLLHHLKHNKVLHEQVMLMSIVSREVPEVPDEERVEVERLPANFVRVVARYGFMEAPNVPEILEYCEESGVSHLRPHEISFFLGRERLIPVGSSRMVRWRKKLFGIMSRNAQGATEFFQIPPNRVVELGAQIEF